MNNSNLQTYSAIILLLIGLGNSVFTAESLVTYEYDLDYSEGFVIENVEKFMEGNDLYPEIGAESDFRSTKYPPVYYFLTAALSYILGVGFLPGRLVSLFSALGVSTLIFLIAREYSETDKYLRYFLPILFLVPYLTIFTATNAKVDMLALFFSFSGLYLFIKDRIVSSSALFLLAIFTKQSFVAGFAACSLILLYNQRNELLSLVKNKDFTKMYEFKTHLKFYSIFGFGALISLGLLYMWQPNIFANILGANMGGFEIRWELISWIHIAFTPLAIGSLYGLYLSRDSLLGLYLGFSTILMVLQFLRGGAWVHSAIEPFALTVLIVSITYNRYNLSRDYLELLVIAQVILFLAAPMVSGNLFEVKHMADDNRAPDSVIRHYVEDGEPIFVEHVGYQLGTTDNYSPEIWGMYELYDAGEITEDEINQFFREKEYEYIITYRRIEHLPLDSFIEENYDFEREVQRNDMILNSENWRVYRWTG